MSNLRLEILISRTPNETSRIVSRIVQKNTEKAAMDRLLRLGGAMPGLSQGPPPSDAPVVDTAEQVEFIFVSICQFDG